VSIPYIILVLFSSLIIALGIAGIIIPFLPGIPLIYAGVLLYSIFTSFEHIRIFNVVLITFLVALSFANDYLFSFMGAKKAGITRYGITGGVIGLIIGLAFSPFGIFSLIIGPIIGIIIAELIASKRLMFSARIGLWALIGFTFGTTINLLIASVIIYMFLKAVLNI